MEAMRESWTDDRLDHMRERMDERFDGVDRRFEEMERRFDVVDRRFEEMERRFEEVDRRFEDVDRRLGGIEVELRMQRREARAEFAALNERFDSFQHDMNALQRTLLQVGGGLIAALATALVALVATQI